MKFNPGLMVASLALALPLSTLTEPSLPSGIRLQGVLTDGFLNNISQTFSGDTALLLLNGGLITMLFLLPLAMISSVFLKARSEALSESTKEAPASMMATEYDLGFNIGKSINSTHIDDVIGTLKYLEKVNVKIINSDAGGKRIQLKNCRSCRSPACEFERGFFAGAFEKMYGHVTVKETKCKATGNGVCEFEVKVNE